MDHSHNAPLGFIDFVVRIVHDKRRMRTLVVRAANEDAALATVIENLQSAELTGWALLDIATAADAQRRHEGRADG